MAQPCVSCLDGRPRGLTSRWDQRSGRDTSTLGMDYVDDDWGMDLARLDDEVLLVRLRDLLDATAPICENCNQEVTGLEQLATHRVGAGHVGTAATRRRHAEASAAGQLPGEPWCGLCGLWCNADSYAAHLRGSRHSAAHQVHLKLWALRFAIHLICTELHRRNVPLPAALAQACPAAAVCPACPEEKGPADGGGVARETTVPVLAEPIPAEEAVGGWAHASAAATAAEPVASGSAGRQSSPVGAEGSLRQEIVSMRAEVASVVDVVSGLAGSVSSMARSVDFLEVSLRDLRHEVEGRGNLVDETAERVRAIERMTRVSRGWQQEAEVAIKSILKKVG